MAQNTTTQEFLVKVEKTEAYIEDYTITGPMFPTQFCISKIGYIKNDGALDSLSHGEETLNIRFGDWAHSSIIRYKYKHIERMGGEEEGEVEKIVICEDENYKQSPTTKERLTKMNPKVRESILSQISPEARSLLEEVLE